MSEAGACRRNPERGRRPSRRIPSSEFHPSFSQLFSVLHTNCTAARFFRLSCPLPRNYHEAQLGTSHLHSAFAAMRGQLRDKAVCNQCSTARSSAVGDVSRNRAAGRDSSSHVCVCANNPRRPCRAVIPLFARQPAHCAPSAGLNLPMRSLEPRERGPAFANAGAVPQRATRGRLACGSHYFSWPISRMNHDSADVSRYAQPLTAFRKKSFPKPLPESQSSLHALSALANLISLSDGHHRLQLGTRSSRQH